MEMLDPAILQALFGSTMMTPATAGTMPMPPTLAPGQGRPVEPYMTDPLATGSPSMPPVPMPQPRPTSLGAALEPSVPMPMSRPAEAPGGTYAAQAGSGTAPDPTKLFGALKGVVAPPPPIAQKVGTPHAPQMAKLQGGNVAELLASLGIGPQQAFPGLKLPSTLGQALGGR